MFARLRHSPPIPHTPSSPCFSRSLISSLCWPGALTQSDWKSTILSPHLSPSFWWLHFFRRKLVAAVALSPRFKIYRRSSVTSRLRKSISFWSFPSMLVSLWQVKRWCVGSFQCSLATNWEPHLSPPGPAWCGKTQPEWTFCLQPRLKHSNNNHNHKGHSRRKVVFLPLLLLLRRFTLYQLIPSLRVEPVFPRFPHSLRTSGASRIFQGWLPNWDYRSTLLQELRDYCVASLPSVSEPPRNYSNSQGNQSSRTWQLSGAEPASRNSAVIILT